MLKLSVVYNGVDDSLLKSLLPEHTAYTLTDTSTPKLRKAWKTLLPVLQEQYDRVLLVGEKLANVALPFLSEEEKGRMSVYHGALVRVGNLIVVPTFLETNFVTAKHRINDIKRFLNAGIPELPMTEQDFATDAGSSFIYLDIETTGLDWQKDEITSLQLSFSDSPTLVYLEYPTVVMLNKLYFYAQKYNSTLVGHNLLFDLSFLSRTTGLDWFSFSLHDTMLMAKARGSSINNLKHLASIFNTKYHPLSYKQESIFNREYAIADVLATQEIHKRLIAKGLRPIDILSFESLQTFGYARLQGIYVDTENLASLQKELSQRIAELDKELVSYAPIEWTNTNQVGITLKALGVPLYILTGTGKLSVTQEILEGFVEYPVVSLLLEHRKITKLLNTFYEEYTAKTQEKPFLYPTINILGTETGRTSCANPNIQQIPLSVRKVFTSRFINGKIGVFDLDRSELVCAVMLSGDAVMAKALLEYDYHKYVASLAFNVHYNEVTKEQRSMAKILTFGALMYGGTPRGIAPRVGTTEKIVEDALVNLRGSFKDLAAWQAEQIAIGLSPHRKIADSFGKVRDLSTLFARGEVSLCRRIAMNTAIQGLSGYVCLILCNFLRKYFQENNMRSIVIAQVHDETIIDVSPDEIEIMPSLVSQAFVSLHHHPVISKLPGFHLIQPTGELKIASSWYEAKQD